MVAKISKKVRAHRSSQVTFQWNGHFTIGLCSLVLLLVSVAVILEDLNFRSTRSDSMKALLEWGDLDGQSFAKANLSVSKKNEYRQSLKMAIGYLKQYQRDPNKNQNALSLSQAQLKIAFVQMDERSQNSSVGLMITKKLKEVESLMESKGMKNEVSSGNIDGFSDNVEVGGDKLMKISPKTPSKIDGEVK